MAKENNFPIESQQSINDCGPAALKMIARYYGKTVLLQDLYRICKITKEGVSLKNLRIAAEFIGFRSMAVKSSFKNLVEHIPFPAIALWENCHYVVIYEANEYNVQIADPMEGYIKYTADEFCKGWFLDGDIAGIILAFEPKSK